MPGQTNPATPKGMMDECEKICGECGAVCAHCAHHCLEMAAAAGAGEV